MYKVVKILINQKSTLCLWFKGGINSSNKVVYQIIRQMASFALGRKYMSTFMQSYTIFSELYHTFNGGAENDFWI